jgi:hypothetical protein
MENKAEVYKTIKIGGMLVFIPLMLLLGPLMGYFLGDFLRAEFGFHKNYVLLFVFGGFFSSILETLRIVRKVSKIDNKKD